MPLPFTIGTGRTLMWRRRIPPSVSDYLIRDDFSDADVSPLVDGSANPGPGTRDVTGALFEIIDASLRGGGQLTTPTWGDSKITYNSQSRADGLALWILAKVMSFGGIGLGWASSAAVTDPTTNGHHWISYEGYGRVSIPGKLITLSGSPDVGKLGFTRNEEYLVCVVLRAQGAFYLVSSHAAHTRTGVLNSNDYIGIPAYPDARVLWVDDTTTTTPMIPHISVEERIGPVHEPYFDDLRVKVIDEWATDAGLASFLDRFTRADSTTSAGPAYTVVNGGVGGVSSNKGYVVSNGGARCQIVNPTAMASGDGIWKWQIVVPTNTAHQWELPYRYADANNWCMVQNVSGTTIQLTQVVAGSGGVIANYPYTQQAGETLDITVITKDAMHQLYVHEAGVERAFVDWTADTASATVRAGTGQGFGSWSVAPTGFRVDNIMAIPSIVTLPADIQTGAVPHQFTVGATIATDAFTAANGTALNGRTTDTGSKTWTTVGAGWEINTNRARNTNIGGAETDFFAYVDAGVADYEVSVDVTTKPSGDRLLAGLVVRRTDANNHIFVRILIDPTQPNNHEIELWETVAGVTLDTCRQMIGVFYVDNTAYTLTVQAVGRFMHIFLGTEPIMSYVTSANLTGTGVGLYHSGADDGSSFDNFAVKALS